jgi:hypothetical protein
VERGRLGLFGLVLRIFLDHWGLGRVETAVSTLESIADVNACNFTALSNGHSTRPSEGSNDKSSVTGGAFFGRELGILLGVTD